MPQTTTLAIDVVMSDGEWANVITDPIRHAHIERVGLLPNGTRAGLPAFELLARTSDGGTVLLETTWASMRTALKTLEAGWPDGQWHVSDPARPAGPPTPTAEQTVRDQTVERIRAYVQALREEGEHDLRQILAFLAQSDEAQTAALAEKLAGGDS